MAQRKFVFNRSHQENLFAELKYDNFCPPLPDLITNLQQANGDLKTVTRFIIQNPPVMVSVLKVVNSPAFGYGQDIIEIEHAVAELGIEAVLKIAAAVMLQETFSGASADMQAYWDGAKKVANTCSAVATHLNIGTRDHAYILGLFHNCGIAALLNKFPNYMILIRQAFAKQDGALTSHENRAIYTDHAEISYDLAKKWKLPHDICEVIKIHHDIDKICAGIDKLNDQLYLLKIAEDITKLHSTLGHQEKNHEWPLIEKAIFSHFGMNHDEYQELIDQVHFSLTV